MSKLLIFVTLFLIKITLHATTIHANSSWVNRLPVRREVQLQLRNDSRYND